MAQQFTLKGINNDVETCEKCGKTGLKRVMWLEVLDEEGNGTGSVIPMGTCCGAKALGFKGQYKSVEQVAEAFKAQEKKTQVIEEAKKMAIQFNDEIAIIRRNDTYYTVRGKAYEANPNRYGRPVQWITQ